MSASALSGFNARKALQAELEKTREEFKSAERKVKSNEWANRLANESKAEIDKIGSQEEAAARLKEVQTLIDDAKRKIPVKLGSLEQTAEYLDLIAKDFGNKAAVLNGIADIVDPNLVENAELAAKIKSLKERVKPLEEEIKAWGKKFPSSSQLDSWEKDRAKDDARKIETDLVKMREALSKLADKKPSTTEDCPFKKKLAEHLAKAEAELDHIAHKAPCHVCATSNGIERTAKAKDLVQAKVTRLQELAALKDDSSLKTDADRADFVLAKALDSMRKDKDETGKTAGKMLGALICENAKGGLEVIYGYSGEIADQWRLAHAGAERLKQKLDQELDPVAKAGLQKLYDQALEEETRLGELDALKESMVRKFYSPPIPQKGVDAILKSLGGATESIEVLNDGWTKTPHGVCAAPKMIQNAKALGLKPVALAEAWFGGGDNAHGAFVASCETCMNNIGFQLCEVCK